MIQWNGIFLKEQLDNPTAFAALLVSLPRQLQVIQNIFAFFGLTLSWEGLRAQLKELEEILGISQTSRDLEEFVKLDEISVTNGGGKISVSKVSQLKGFLDQKDNGRFTLRGKNGAGKSTLLSILAEHTGESSFFLPSHFSDLSFKSDELISQSDGNRLLHAFEEIKNLSEVKFVFLDEWDANLDISNIDKINSAIEVLSQRKVVLESRHRA